MNFVLRDHILIPISGCQVKEIFSSVLTLPVPLSMKTTLEIGRKLVPLSRSSSPPSTEQEVRLTDSMTGSSWAERWAEARKKRVRQH